MLGMKEPEISQPSGQINDSTTMIYQSSVENIEDSQINTTPVSQQISTPNVINQNIEMSAFEDLLNTEVNSQAPPQQIMGMIGMDGKESIEYPINSGIKWTRNNPSDEWSKSN